jgi:hypothetical protein
VVAFLARAARADDVNEAPTLVLRHRRQWRALTPARAERLAQVPYLLLDWNFSLPQWWRDAISERAETTIAGSGALPDTQAGEWAQEILALAMMLLHKNRGAARLLLGLHAASADKIRNLSAAQARELVAHHAGEVRLRWSESPYYWSRALQAARAPGGDEMRSICHYGIQLIGAVV